jgi:uncharacterized membrane protein
MSVELALPKETQIMDMTTRPRFATTLLIAAASLLPVGAAVAQATTTGGEMMRNEHWYGYGGGWLPALAIVVMGAVLFAVLRRKQ